MPNNPARHKAGFVKVPGGTLKAKKRDVVSSLRVVNKAFVSSAQEAGSPNGTPGPTYQGGGNPDFGGIGAGGGISGTQLN